MNSRNLSLLTAIVCIGAAVGIWLFGQGAQAVELPPGGDLDDAKIVESVVSDQDSEPHVATGDLLKSNQVTVNPAQANQQKEDTSDWTSGTIRGDVKLAVSVLDKLGSITAIVEEVRSSFENGGNYKPPVRIYAQVDRGEGTPTFTIRDVPFSDFPYRVTLHAAGLNGSQRTLTVNKEQPLHDIVLSITPGAPFSVLLRDQDFGPHSGVDLLLRPVGLPNGRVRLAGKTDNFGSVVFESVLAGNYELVPTVDNKPFGEVATVTVLPGNRNYDRKIQGQGYVMTIPRGVDVTLRVHDINGYSMPGCAVTAVKTDQRKLVEPGGETDLRGELLFKNLKPGTWMFTVQFKGFKRVDMQITLKQDQEPLRKEIRLVRNRIR